MSTWKGLADLGGQALETKALGISQRGSVSVRASQPQL